MNTTELERMLFMFDQVSKDLIEMLKEKGSHNTARDIATHIDVVSMKAREVVNEGRKFS